jgi:hypothetical protein
MKWDTQPSGHSTWYTLPIGTSSLGLRRCGSVSNCLNQLSLLTLNNITNNNNKGQGQQAPALTMAYELLFFTASCKTFIQYPHTVAIPGRMQQSNRRFCNKAWIKQSVLQHGGFTPATLCIFLFEADIPQEGPKALQ